MFLLTTTPRHLAILLFLSGSFAPSVARAHSGTPSQAILLDPEQTGPPVDDGYLLHWNDQNASPLTGPSFVNVYYTAELPETQFLGGLQETLTGTAVVTNIPEDDLENSYFWDTSQVPTGVYWLWSRVDEPAEEMSPIYIRFSPSPVIVEHEGELAGPAISLTDPSSAFAQGDRSFQIRYSAWDPSGSGRVRLEAVARGDSVPWLVADGLPARRDATFNWDTSRLPDGNYALIATVEDCCGGRHRAWARYFVYVAHIPELADAGPFDTGASPHDGGAHTWCEVYDGGVALSCTGELLDASEDVDGGRDDSGTFPADSGAPRPDGGAVSADGGVTDLPDPEGCNCQAVQDNGTTLLGLSLLGLGLFWRRRWR